MSPLPKTLELARSLVSREAGCNEPAPQTPATTVRVYERLRRQLGASMGAGGFQALAARALNLARAESPGLKAVQVTAQGELDGLDEAASSPEGKEQQEPGIALIAQLLALFLAFLGEPTTLSLLKDLDVQVQAGSPGATTDTTPDGPAAPAEFEDLLREIDRLRGVGDQIETLAGKHPEMEAGLVSVAANIRSMATVLDIFALIKSRAGGKLDAATLPPGNGYTH